MVLKKMIIGSLLVVGICVAGISQLRAGGSISRPVVPSAEDVASNKTTLTRVNRLVRDRSDDKDIDPVKFTMVKDMCRTTDIIGIYCSTIRASFDDTRREDERCVEKFEFEEVEGVCGALLLALRTNSHDDIVKNNHLGLFLEADGTRIDTRRLPRNEK